MSMLGQADLGIAILNDMVQNASMIASLDRSIPLIAHADTGYGGPLMVGRTTAQYMQAGIAAFHLEDQVQTKRCGHLRNKELVDEEVYLSRIKAAVNMRGQTPGDIVIIARTDALQSLGFEAALSRLKRAVAIGADVAFLEGIATAEEARIACKELAPTPLLLDNVAGGLTPKWTVQEAKEIGFRIVIYPGFALGPVYEAVKAAAKELKETGDLQVTAGTSPKEIFEVCGLSDVVKFDVDTGGNLYSKGV
jgi:2-methylisocitrate lyase-like PEP mutase family enzyme